MKLLRLKITDPDGFRSLPRGFEHDFRTDWSRQNELEAGTDFAPFVCAGRNGSGKSNLLEALAAIFYQLDVQRVRRNFLPTVLMDADDLGAPHGFELEYLIHPTREASDYAQVRVLKEPGSSPRMYWLNAASFGELAEGTGSDGECGERQRELLLPDFVLGYSSGENEVLSLPFFKLRFVAFDEYWTALRERQAYAGHPDARLAYLDSGFSQAILLCNLLFAEGDEPPAFAAGTGIEALSQFRIVLRRSLPLDEAQAERFMAPIIGNRNERPLITFDADSNGYRLDVLRLLREYAPDEAKRSSLAVDALRRCATLEYLDDASDSLVLDYRVDAHTREAFKANFGNDLPGDGPRALFQALQVLLTLNLYSVSDSLKADLYRSDSDYVRETVPTLASDERVMRFKHVSLRKQGVDKPLSLKSLSDGEHQLLHSLGLCSLFAGSRCLFLLDEPETHFNPDWRASFITRLAACLGTGGKQAEMLLTTHSPFPISDSTPDKVLLFERDEASGALRVHHPDYNTLGASINKITMLSFGKRDTIGGHAKALLDDVRQRFADDPSQREALIDELDRTLGDSVEKVLLVNAMLAGNAHHGTESA
jgi:restriction system-associated AAA family ATPase